MMNPAKRLLVDYSSRTLARARNYVREGRVLQVVSDANASLSASVRGTRVQPYAVTVDWSSGYAEGECDCPVGLDCKHAAAALLAFFEERGSPVGKKVVSKARSRSGGKAASDDNATDPALSKWLAELDEMNAPPPGKTRAASLQAIVYLLDLKTWSGLPCLRLRVCKARRRKDGSYADIARYNPHNALSGRTANFIQEADLEIFYRLMSAQRDNTLEYALLSERDTKLLPVLLETGRCHWRSADPPALQPGPPRQGQWQWRLDENARQHLTLKTAPEAQPLPLSPPYYVDTQTGDCGPLQTQLPARQAQTLLQSPPLNPRQAEQAHKRLDQRLPAALPRPRKLEIESRADVKPRPVLRLGTSPQPAWRSLYVDDEPMATAWAELRFNYDGVEISAADRRRHLDRLQDTRVIRIERDARAESAAGQELAAFFPASAFQSEQNLPAGALTLGVGEEHWVEFIGNEVPRLERQGWRVDVAADFPLQALSDNPLVADIEAGEDWFGLGLGVDINGERINLLPLLLEALARLPARSRTAAAITDDAILRLPLSQGRTVAVPAARLKPILTALIELYDKPPLDHSGRLRLGRLDAPRLADLDATHNLQWHGGDALRALGDKLRNFKGVERVNVPRGFRGTLRGYQRAGLDWLQFLRSYEFGGILADDMGLGKTIQTLAHLLVEKRAHRDRYPSLLVVPTSLLHNWSDEAARFAPSLRLLSLHGADRADKFERINAHDLVLTTYPLLPRDAATLKQPTWHYVILDEAQVIKNPRTKAARIVYALKSNHRLCLTGTPMENHLGELWSLFRFLMPGFLGDMKSFRRIYRTPIEKHGDAERREHLARRVRPFLLRRGKDEVAAELPPKTEMVRSIELQGAQRDLYESVRLTMHKKIRAVVADKGFARSQIEILEALLKLRQVCCDPRLLKDSTKSSSAPSAKLERLMELLGASLEDGRQVLLFSQFTEMLGLIERSLAREKISYTKLTGAHRAHA